MKRIVRKGKSFFQPSLALRQQFTGQQPLTRFYQGSLPQQQQQQQTGQDKVDETARSYVATFGFPGEFEEEDNLVESFPGEHGDEDVSASSRSGLVMSRSHSREYRNLFTQAYKWGTRSRCRSWWRSWLPWVRSSPGQWYWTADTVSGDQ